MFVSKVSSLPYNVAPENSFTWLGSGLAHKHWTRLEKLVRDKRSSVLQKFVTYVRKKFNYRGPRPNELLREKISLMKSHITTNY
jgi:hypothetical protein